MDLVCSDLLRHLANWAMTPPAVPTLPSRAHLQDYGRRTTPSNYKMIIIIKGLIIKGLMIIIIIIKGLGGDKYNTN